MSKAEREIASFPGHANLSAATASVESFRGADLQWSNLLGLTSEKSQDVPVHTILSHAKTLYSAMMDLDVWFEIEQRYPQLLCYPER
jgi:uncharacterized protein YjbI with pentapeptide repeats